MVTRREFIDALAASAASLAVASTAKSYGQILGSNDRLNFAVIGLNSRAYAHLSSLKANKRRRAYLTRLRRGCQHPAKVCRRDAEGNGRRCRSRRKTSAKFSKRKDVDAITIATPDHWHAPMAIAGLQAGKHVYVEKPCSHNPAEGALLVEAQKKYGKLVQMGTQQRSSPHTIEIVDKIHDGLIGRPYFAKAWYVNTRKSIGIGKEVPVPRTLDWDLWQGPAPRRPTKITFTRTTGTGSASGAPARH